jgi:isopenicillin N synthase-like dioxygenase/RimJ/RimL family protein N-acetyltransferase
MEMNPAGTNNPAALAKRLPDIPRWTEARSLLRSRECQLFGYDSNSDELAFIVTAPDRDPICIIGFPDKSAIVAATSNAGESTVVLASLENESHVARMLPGWRPEPAVLHTLADPTRLPDFSSYDVRFVTQTDLEISTLPSGLQDELKRARTHSPVAAVFLDDIPVSFCYAGSETETLWDISIDTIDAYRRRGYGGVCVAFLIEHFRQLGKEPVWGALESNEASMRLAEKLGFVPVDRLIVFQRNESIPIIDVEALVTHSPDAHVVAQEIGRACREFGFFYIKNHGISLQLQQKLESLSRAFFDLDLETKMQIHMSRGGRAWRGYFPLGEELTSGAPDLKEGVYFGAELDSHDPRVEAGLLMHGSNLFPSLPDFREVVLEYIDVMTQLGHRLVEGISLSLGLSRDHFHRNYSADPFVLFRIFNYPAPGDKDGWGVAEHTDYGLLTILKQDDAGGLEVKVGARWIAAPPIEGTFVCNIGDMLDRMTGGMYRSTPHRARNVSGRDRLSFPFFFDPGFDTRVQPVFEDRRASDDKEERWDHASVHEFSGTYGDYLLGKVSRVFPSLRAVTEQTEDRTKN